MAWGVRFASRASVLTRRRSAAVSVSDCMPDAPIGMNDARIVALPTTLIECREFHPSAIRLRAEIPMRNSLVLAFPLLLGCTGALAGGSNYGISPGAKQLTGKISEWPVPTPKFARDPAPGPDGNIYITVMQGDRIARFDTKSQKFNEWDLPPGAHPHGLLVDKEGKVWYTGNGNGTIGELDPTTGKVIEHKAGG